MNAPEKIWSINNKMTSSNDMSAYGPQWVEYTRTDLSQAAVAAALEAGYALGMDAGAWDAMSKADGDYETPMPDSLKLDALITPAQHDALAAHVAAEVAKARAEDAVKIAQLEQDLADANSVADDAYRRGYWAGGNGA